MMDPRIELPEYGETFKLASSIGPPYAPAAAAAAAVSRQ